MGPVLERSPGASAHLIVGAVLVFETIPFHPRPDQDRGILQLPASDVAFKESVPATEHVPGLLEHQLREQVGVRTAPAVPEALELADQMRPAQLPHPVLVVVAVGRMVVGDDHPFVDLAQNGSDDLGTTTGGEGEIDGQLRDKDPKVMAQPFTLPTGFIDVEAGSIGKALPDLLGDRLQFRAQPGDAVANGSQTEVQPEKRVQDLDDASAADLVHALKYPMAPWTRVVLIT